MHHGQVGINFIRDYALVEGVGMKSCSSTGRHGDVIRDKENYSLVKLHIGEERFSMTKDCDHEAMRHL